MLLVSNMRDPKIIQKYQKKVVNEKSPYSWCGPIFCWLVLWSICYFPIYWECHHPNWRTHIFQRRRYTTNQLTIINHHIPIIFPSYSHHIPIPPLEGIVTDLSTLGAISAFFFCRQEGKTNPEMLGPLADAVDKAVPDFLSGFSGFWGKAMALTGESTITIENGHGNTDFSHEKKVIFHGYVSLPDGIS